MEYSFETTKIQPKIFDVYEFLTYTCVIATKFAAWWQKSK